MIMKAKAQASAQVPKLFFLLLAVQALATFLSEAKFIPIRRNIGPFETNAIVLSLALFFYLLKNSRPLKSHPVIFIMYAWFVLAMLSLVNMHNNIPSLTYWLAIIILLFQVIFTIVLFNVLSLDPSLLLFLLRCFAVAALFASLWVLVDQVTSGDYNAAGPFRNRSHMGLYMLSVFWLMLMYNFWPGLAKWEQWATYPVLALVLYVIAVSLRQSVYVAMAIGLVLLVFSSVISHGKERFKIIGMVIISAVIIIFLYQRGGTYLPQLSLFQREALAVPDRLSAAFATAEDVEDSDGFSVLQRQGALQAFFDHPFLGIGWMGFYRSDYSPTGHELHSTPFRFMAELGVFGVVIYLLFYGILLYRSGKLFLLMRKTPYQLPALLLFLGFCSLTVSHYYNRMFTDRPFWFMVVIFLALEAFLLENIQTKPAMPFGRMGRAPLLNQGKRTVETY
jgi:O-antigen ligase